MTLEYHLAGRLRKRLERPAYAMEQQPTARERSSDRSSVDLRAALEQFDS